MRIKQNTDLTTWWQDKEKIKNGVYMVVINKETIPISNQLCPLCSKGWHEPCHFAATGNMVFHKECLIKKLGQAKFDVFVANKRIVTE